MSSTPRPGTDMSSATESPPAKVPRTRISRACENCRARRKKCQPPFPCQACRDAGLPDCLASSAPLANSTYPERTRFLSALDEELEHIYTAQTGETLSLAIEEAPTHPDCELSTPLPPLPSPLAQSAADAMDAFALHLLPFCSYMTAPRVMALFERYLAQPDALAPDQAALMLASLALGYLRLRGFVPDTGRVLSIALPIPDDAREDVPFFRHAVDILERWGSASFTSLRGCHSPRRALTPDALSNLWYYCTMACTSDTTRVIVSWMIAQAKELGIHQEQPGGAHTYAPSDRADLMFLQVLYAHYWSTALTGLPPMIKPGEFETMTFRSRPVPQEDMIALVPRRSFTELLLLNTQLMIALHDAKTPVLSLDWMLCVEERWDTWCATWVADGRTVGNVYTDPFIGMLWDWCAHMNPSLPPLTLRGRLSLRAIALPDRRLSTASMAVLARSATKILRAFQDMYSRLPFNLVWQHLRKTITCAHVVLLTFWRYELARTEAEPALGAASWVLHLMETRWRAQAAGARRKIALVADAIGLTIPPPPHIPPPPAADTTPSSDVDSLAAPAPGPPPPPVMDAMPIDPSQFSFGFLYEPLGFGAGDAAPLAEWTIDPLFLGDYA